MDNNEVQRPLPGFEDVVTPASVIERHLHKEGLLFAQLEHALRWDPTRDFFPYQVDIRRCGGRDGETLIVFKAIREGEAVIGFHSDVGMVGTLRSLIGRLRSGKIVYKLDERPGKLLEKVIPELDYWQEHFGKSGGSRPQTLE